MMKYAGKHKKDKGKVIEQFTYSLSTIHDLKKVAKNFVVWDVRALKKLDISFLGWTWFKELHRKDCLTDASRNYFQLESISWRNPHQFLASSEYETVISIRLSGANPVIFKKWMKENLVYWYFRKNKLCEIGEKLGKHYGDSELWLEMLISDLKVFEMCTSNG